MTSSWWPFGRPTPTDLSVQIAQSRSDTLAAISNLQQQVTAMSQTLATDIAAIQAALTNLQAAVVAATQKISDLAGKLADALANAATPEQVQALAADAQEIQKEADALNAAVNPAP